MVRTVWPTGCARFVEPPRARVDSARYFTARHYSPHWLILGYACPFAFRVNMKAIEVTIHNLIASGMDPKTENNAYLGFIYTSFQERATKVG